MNNFVQNCRHMRADAQRNHASLLTAARSAVAKHGEDIVLEDIARSAGVAIGTLYRHFPTRQHLLEALFLDATNTLTKRAEELAIDPRPLDALVNWLHFQMDFAAQGRSMGAAVMAAKHDQESEIHIAYEGMLMAAEVLFHRAQKAGEVRTDVELVDVLRLVYGIVLATEHASASDRANRMFDLVIAGIKPRDSD
ncbi:TetR/AcrR family transcriptional regulator [Alicyclobacillus sp. ALC3]|uniref:TetR/AcrR family transcriptional regulator n=1 Tax=Alicyclobacillus sp. ALC3 TaxID=2796143 RepID=UPI002377F00C|nr:TetR/AcrR family transcriptional regulator [Alicyclobacillus sp. ALC3]WDL95828.1 TetR/AcrR family transcriptional regulator [Alicyclobacillus sp. ALC3]